jgi:hypothetical protein
MIPVLMRGGHCFSDYPTKVENRDEGLHKTSSVAESALSFLLSPLFHVTKRIDL